MCAAKKKETTDGPSHAGMIVSAVAVALFGGFLGFLYLSTYPAVAFSGEEELAAHVESKTHTGARPGDVYYFEGATQRTQAWAEKRQGLLGGQVKDVALSDAELNAWFSAKFKSGSAPANGKKSNLVIIPGVPNIYISEASVYISLPTEISFFGKRKKYTVFARGHFAEGASPKFVMETLYMNNSVIPMVSLIGKQLMRALSGAYTSTEEYQSLSEAWDRIESINVVSNTMRLQLR